MVKVIIRLSQSQPIRLVFTCYGRSDWSVKTFMAKIQSIDVYAKFAYDFAF